MHLLLFEHPWAAEHKKNTPENKKKQNNNKKKVEEKDQRLQLSKQLFQQL